MLSIKNAVLAIYPLSSKNDIPKNNTNINGKNGRAPPNPPIIPSTISEWNQGLEFANKASTGVDI